MNKIVKSVALSCSAILLGGGCTSMSDLPVAYNQLARFVGGYSYGHEVQSFQPCNSSLAYWAVLPSSEVERLNALSLQKAKQEGRPYQPVYLEVTGMLQPSAEAEGFAANYDAILKVEKISKVSKTLPKLCGQPDREVQERAGAES
ncbi:MAG: hypothetical protein CSA68_09660 [Rhodobacterales bacterium]|nr:MAG: hypothetical protein CSA68_09660 [Rhodobacterales bacterium]